MAKQSITILEYANHFGLIWINGDRDAMKREITERGINRPGLELAGFFDYAISKRLIFIGNKEASYIKNMKDKYSVSVYRDKTNSSGRVRVIILY